MSHRIVQKLRSRRGESLTETLVAVLVVALSSTVLASMLLSATRQNQLAMERDAALYSQLTKAETRAEAPSAGTVTIRLDGKVAELTVQVHGQPEALLAYDYAVGGGGAP